MFVVIFICGNFFCISLEKQKWEPGKISRHTVVQQDLCWLHSFFHPSINPSSSRHYGQHQFSPNRIYASSRELVMRINKVMFKGKVLWSFNKFSQIILEECMETRLKSLSFTCLWIFVLKGLTWFILFFFCMLTAVSDHNILPHRHIDMYIYYFAFFSLFSLKCPHPRSSQL